MQEANRDSIDVTLLMQPPPGFDMAIIKGGAKGVTVVEVSGGSTRIERIPAFPVKTSSSIGPGLGIRDDGYLTRPHGAPRLAANTCQ